MLTPRGANVDFGDEGAVDWAFLGNLKQLRALLFGEPPRESCHDVSRAFFTEHTDISKREVIAPIAERFGISASDVESVWHERRLKPCDHGNRRPCESKDARSLFACANRGKAASGIVTIGKGHGETDFRGQRDGLRYK